LTGYYDGLQIGDMVEVEVCGLANTALLGKFIGKSTISAFKLPCQ
jgi:hypothetical protein